MNRLNYAQDWDQIYKSIEDDYSDTMARILYYNRKLTSVEIAEHIDMEVSGKAYLHYSRLVNTLHNQLWRQIHSGIKCKEGS